MIYKYQLIILGTTGKLSDRIVDLFFEKLIELKQLKDSFILIDENNFTKEYKANQPAFAIYFGDKNRDFKNIEIIDKLLKDATLILPIYYDSFSAEIPKILENQNGQLYDETKDSKITNLALESFGKLRHTRKVFISYKRDESSSVAIQLYEAMEKNNFDVFLDTHSIKQGEPFQEELWHRMTDCDVIVLLNTPKFLTSKWCKEELAEANAKQIGIVQLIWPNNKIDSAAHVSFPKYLKDSDFIDNLYKNKDASKLQEDIVNEIVSSAESVRARNLASRQDNLITEFSNIALKYGKKINLQPERIITEELGNKKRRIFIPTIGIPQSLDCNMSEELAKEISEYEVESVYLIFDDIRIREKWLKHLDWLNNYLKIKTLKKQNFDKWFQKN
ncbi:toll/interleukin-1 receptor domain-containing protein [Christiangramia echinicola]|uniref:toll/interleukin-1 receptor domain-containing protein n=1 Tax=Christiangramia echinicola TaxID=279359 RepID=UPI0004283655|nr:toll/interleukin-1 receptor domain-containing protein [Christiangramia echinicola]